MKKICVIIRNLPLGTVKNSEALRMSVGLTIEEGNQVNVIFTDEGVLTLTQLKPEIVGMPSFRKPLETLTALEIPLYAEKEAVDERKITTPEGVELKTTNEIYEIIKEQDTIIPF